MPLPCRFLLLACFVFFAGSTYADWNLAGPSSLNMGNTQTANYPAIAGSDTSIYVAWQEKEFFSATNSRTAIYVKHYNGISWRQVGGSLPLNMCNTQSAYYPDIVLINSLPYVTWTEADYAVPGGRYAVFMKRLNFSDQWVQAGGPANRVFTQHAINPRIAAADNGTPYLTWLEQEAGVMHVIVKHWNGAAWIQDGGILNRANTQNAVYSSIAVGGNTPYVAWQETEYSNGTTACDRIYVKRLNGTNWDLVNDIVNMVNYRNATLPSIVIGTTPYVAWYENDVVSGVPQINIAKEIGFWFKSWAPPSMNMEPAMPAYNPNIAVNSYVPFVTWHEFVSPGGNAQVYVKANRTGNSWDMIGATLNANMSYNALSPRLGFRGTTAYVAWHEAPVPPVAAAQQVYVKYYATPTPTITKTFTVTPTFTTTPTITHTYTCTPSSTISPTPTISPTVTQTKTATITRTITETVTRTVTITQTGTMTPYVLANTEVICYPAPAVGREAWFYYHVTKPSDVKIEIFNVLGEKALVLTDHHDELGYRRTRWDISAVATGVYLYRLSITNADGTQTSGFKKMMIVKK